MAKVMLSSLNRTYSTLNYLAQLLLILRLSSVNHWLSIDNHMLSSLNRTYIHLALPRNTEIKLMVTHLLILTDKHPYSWLISLTLMSYLRRSFFLIVLNVCHTADILGLCLGFAWVTGQRCVLLLALPGICLGYGLVLFLSVQGRKVLRNVQLGMQQSRNDNDYQSHPPFNRPLTTVLPSITYLKSTLSESKIKSLKCFKTYE